MTERSGAPPSWLETGIPRLDQILGGGLLRGSLAMVIGPPGVGKTVLAQQMAFAHAAQGGVSLFLTGYSETHEKLLTHSRGLSFFNPALIGDRVHFANLLDLLREGPAETREAISTTARQEQASLVVMDGFRGMRRLLRDDAVVADFLYSLGASLALLGATTVVVIEGDPEDSVHYAEITVCDIIVALHRELHTGVQRRRLEVVKARGSSPLEGKHPYTITSAGISLFPRFESLVTDTATSGWTADRLPFGLEGLDALLGGGLTAGTTTLVAGSPGTGKTLLGTQFVMEGARTGEPALFLGFMESAEQLREQARTFGLDLASVEAAGQARLLTMPGYDQEVDAIASLVMEDIEQRRTKRLVIDSVSQLERSVGDPERNAGFLSALVGYLRQHGVTTYITLDIPTIAGPALEFAATPLSVIAENLLLMRNVEYRGELHRVFSVLKMRFSNHDRAIYEYGITPGEGIRISGPAPLGEGLLTGMARPLLDIPMQREIDAG